MINISSIFFALLLICIFTRPHKLSFYNLIWTLLSLIGIALPLVSFFITDGKFKIIKFRRWIVNVYSKRNNMLLDFRSVIFNVCEYFNISGSVVQENTLNDGFEIYKFFIWRSIFGVIITAVEFYFFELDNFLSYEYNYEIILLIVCASLCLLIFNIIVPFYIKRCKQAMFDISQVSQIFWSFIISIIVFQEKVIFY